jgi:hypothetical protein
MLRGEASRKDNYQPLMGAQDAENMPAVQQSRAGNEEGNRLESFISTRFLRYVLCTAENLFWSLNPQH